MDLSGYYGDFSSNNRLGDLHAILKAYATAGHKRIARKVSEGTGYHWYEGDQFADIAHQLGLCVDHYHWLRPDQDAAAQANYFLGLLHGHLHEGDRIMPDIESTAGASDISDAHRADQLRTFRKIVVPKLPATVGRICYTGDWYLYQKPQLTAEIRDNWDVDDSNYSTTPDEQVSNPYGYNRIVRQFTDRARIPGFPDPADYNRTLAGAVAKHGGLVGTDVPTKPGKPVPTIKGDSMFCLLHERQSHRWYEMGEGYFRRVKASDYPQVQPGRVVEILAKNPLCTNGAAILAVRKGGLTPAEHDAEAAKFRFSKHTLAAMRHHALKGAA